MTWGEYIKKKRLEAGIGLREFASQVGLLPSNYNHMEKGRSYPPQDKAKLDQIAEALSIAPDSEEYRTLLDLAVEGKDKLPADVAEFATSNKMVPVLLRTINDKKLSDEEFRSLVERVNTELTTKREVDASDTNL